MLLLSRGKQSDDKDGADDDYSKKKKKLYIEKTKHKLIVQWVFSFVREQVRACGQCEWVVCVAPSFKWKKKRHTKSQRVWRSIGRQRAIPLSVIDLNYNPLVIVNMMTGIVRFVSTRTTCIPQPTVDPVIAVNVEGCGRECGAGGRFFFFAVVLCLR